MPWTLILPLIDGSSCSAWAMSVIEPQVRTQSGSPELAACAALMIAFEPSVGFDQPFDGATGMLPCLVIECRKSEEHTSELQSLMSNSYAVFCLKKKNYE